MDRRKFLKFAGLTVAGSIVFPSIVSSCTKDGSNGPEGGKQAGKPTGHFSLMQMTNAGTSQMMCYILKTRENKVIVIDGGTPAETDKLRSKLAELGNHVTAWWITHPHGDHIGPLAEILKDRKGITIDTIYHSRFSKEHYNREAGAAAKTEELYTLFDNQIETDVVSIHSTGGRYDLDGIHIKVLGVTNEDITYHAYNNSSMIIRFEDDTKSVVFLGDAEEACGDKVIQKYHKYLNCDYLQMAHHGQQGVKESFYRAISFKTCLWPTPKWLWDAAEGNANNYRTWETRNWMKAKGLKESANGEDDHRIMWRDIDWYLE